MSHPVSISIRSRGMMPPIILWVSVVCVTQITAESPGQTPPSSEPPTNDASVVQDALRRAAESLQHGRAEAALDDLRAIDAVEPNNPWAWYFRGRAHGLLGAPYEAMEAYDRALDELAAAGNPEPELVRRIQAARRVVRRQVFHLSFQMGLAYDSNVTFSGDGATAEFISGRGDGKFATQWRMDYMPYATAERSIAVGVRLNHAWHFSIKEFNFQNYGGYARFTQRLNARWAFDLRYDYDLAYLGNQPFSSIHALSPRFSYRWTSTDSAVEPVETSWFYRIEARDYLYPTSAALDRDGFVNAVGIEQTVRIRPAASRPDWVWDAFAGYQFQSVATEGTEFDRFGNNVYLGVDVPMSNPWLEGKSLTARFIASAAFDDYRNRSRFDRRRRERDDVIPTVGLILSQVLVDDPERGDLILHGIFNWTDSDSNVVTRRFATPFSYDKIVAGFQLEWRF